MPLGKNLEAFLNSKILYIKADGDTSTLTIKLDFPSVDNFFVATKVGDKWKGSELELEWARNLLYSNVKELDKAKPVVVKYIEYKDSVFDDRGVIVALISFEQDAVVTAQDEHLRPPQEDVDAALVIERGVKPEEQSRYLEFMNGKPMSMRKTPRELRDGCMLSQLFARHRG